MRVALGDCWGAAPDADPAWPELPFARRSGNRCWAGGDLPAITLSGRWVCDGKSRLAVHWRLQAWVACALGGARISPLSPSTLLPPHAVAHSFAFLC